ncbi:hypothetical protein [Fibrella arboris]|uniref:hypothetical protein n=1 Tax=Fibrella arboris TaxID=3242486 RepID=UPI0035223955
MYENNPAYQEYPEVTPDANTIEEPNDHKKAVAAAVGGSVVLGAAAYGLSLLDDGSGTEAPIDDNASDIAAAAAADARARASVPVVPVVMPVESPDDKLNWPLDRLDELTFDEAFAAARHQMGPAHHFNWHVGKPEGGLFNTYFKDEEEKLTPEARAAFIATLPIDNEATSAVEPAMPSRVVHPSVEPHEHHVPAAEPQLAVADDHPTEQAVPVAAVVPAMTVVPLAAVSDQEVTPMPLAADVHPAEPLLAEHDASSVHHGSIAGSTIDSIDHHAQFEYDPSHDNFDGMDPHHLGE